MLGDARCRTRMGLSPRPWIPLIVDPAERTGDDNELATMASPTTQRHIRRVQRQDGTQSTSSGASREGDEVAMSPDGGDTSPPTKLFAGDGPVMPQCTGCCAPQTQPRPTSGRVSDAASASIAATPLPDNRPPPAFAPSGVPHPPGASAATDPSNTPSVQPMMRQSTVSGAVGAGQPAADRENVDGGPTQEMVASELELEHPAMPATTGAADAWVTVIPGDTVNGEGDHPPTEGPNAHTPRVPP